MEESTDFFKRLPLQRTGINRREAELANARYSVYRWWYEFLKLSKDYWWMSQITNHRSADEAFQNVWNGFGDIYRNDFDSWWLSRGRTLFVEQRLPGAVRELDFRTMAPSDFGEKQVVLTVPLTIRKETVMRQIRKILKHHYDRQFDVLQHSTAQFKLHTGRYRLEALAIAYEVWITHRQHVTLSTAEKKPKLYEIGNMLKLSQNTQTSKFVVDARKTDKQRIMNAMVSRYLRKANALIKNAEIGRFPCYDENLVIAPDRFNERQRKALAARDDEWNAWEFVYPKF